MGVDVQAFVIVGVRLPGDAMPDDDDARDRLLPYMEGAPEANGFQIVYDGMSGSYVIAGKLIAASDQQDGHFENPVVVKGEISPAECIAIEAKIRELFPDQPWQPLSAIVVSHYH
jgi:hypothetical protein